jgi:hypothetical protein
MNKLKSKLKEHWPPKRIVVTCNECGVELLDTNKKRPTSYGYSYVSALIMSFARRHMNNTDHTDICVDVDKKSVTPKKEIDCEIKIND